MWQSRVIMTALGAHGERLLAEATAPTTSGERLRAIVGLHPSDPWPEPWGPILAAALRNPSLPLDVLHGALLRGSVDAWQNPAASLAMLAHPDPAYPDSALQALVRLERLHPRSSVPPPMVVDATALGRRLRWWAAAADFPDDNAPVRHFARLLATLLP